MLSNDITAVHVSIDPEEAEKIQKKWETWGDGYRLVILDSPYRLFIEPLLEYIEEIDDQRQPNEVITIVVPQFIPKHIMDRGSYMPVLQIRLRKVAAKPERNCDHRSSLPGGLTLASRIWYEYQEDSVNESNCHRMWKNGSGPGLPVV